MREVTLQEMREIQLSILECVAKFCEEKGLRFSLSGGTLLGAIRHKGFIPWDDDIDVVLPRPDYEIFLNEFKASQYGFVLQHAENDLCYPFLFAKVYDPRTVLEEKFCVTGVYIDIFPIDGLPAFEQQHQYVVQLMQLKPLLWRCNVFFKERSKAASWGEKLLYRYRHWFAMKKLKEFREINAYEKAEYAGGIVASFPEIEHMPRSVFESHITCEFEGREFQCIADYDTYLRVLYGDYMQLPPEEKRVAPHPHNVYWKE